MASLRTPVAPRRTPTRGMSLVELLVGLALGLFVVAAGAALLAGHLRDKRALVLEARLMQDLRTTSELLTRDLRRAGYWAGASAAVMPVGAVPANPYAAVEPAAGSAEAVSYRYSRDEHENSVVDSNEQFGFRLRNGVIEKQLGAGNWQAMTDAGTLRVTEFSVTPGTESVDLSGYCATPCPAGASGCPRLLVRSLALRLAGVSATDATVARSLRSQVRLRNDVLAGTCPA